MRRHDSKAYVRNTSPAPSELPPFKLAPQKNGNGLQQILSIESNPIYDFG